MVNERHGSMSPFRGLQKLFSMLGPHHQPYHQQRFLIVLSFAPGAAATSLIECSVELVVMTIAGNIKQRKSTQINNHS